LPIDLKIPAGGGGDGDSFHRFTDRLNGAFEFEDFLAKDGATIYGGNLEVEDTCNMAVSQAEAGGVVELSGQVGTFQTNVRAWSNVNAGEIFTVEWRVKALARPGTLYVMFGVYLNSQNWIGIGWPSAGNFRAYSLVANVLRINADTGIPYDNDWHRFKIISDSTQTTFYIDGVLVHTDVQPNVNYVLNQFNLAAYFVNGDASADVDWLYAHQAFPIARNP